MLRQRNNLALTTALPVLRLVLATIPALILPFSVLAADEASPDTAAETEDKPASPEELELKKNWETYQALLDAGDFPAALDMLAITADQAKYVLPEGDKRTAALELNYAMLLHKLGHDVDAGYAFDNARDLYIAAYGENSVGLVPLLMAEGDRLAKPGDSIPQKRAYQDALKLVGKEYGKKSLEYAELSLDAGMRLLNQSASVRGSSMIQDSIDIYEKQLGSNHPKTAKAHISIAQIFFAKGKVATADRHLEIALSGMDVSTVEGTKKVIETRRYLARAYVRIDKSGKATRHLEQIALLSANGTNQPPFIIAAVAPDYPYELQEDGIGGQVTFMIEVNEEGYVSDFELIGNEGPEELIKPARKAVRKYRYAPAVENNQLVAYSNLEVTVDFDAALQARLENAGNDPVPVIMQHRNIEAGKPPAPPGATRSQRRAPADGNKSRRN